MIDINGAGKAGQWGVANAGYFAAWAYSQPCRIRREMAAVSQPGRLRSLGISPNRDLRLRLPYQRFKLHAAAPPSTV